MEIELSVLFIFSLVYFGMILGNWPGLALDRTGIALLGAIAIIELQSLSLQEAVADIDISSIAILFSFMIISAQFYFSGFYTQLAWRVENWSITPEKLLFVIILIAGVLSALLINDIVCLALTPLLINICQKKKLNPTPFLLGLACSSNVGSALTLIGNPQNMLIGQVVHIPFAEYTLNAAVPCVLGWPVIWWIIKFQTKGQWYQESHEVQLESPKFDSWQSGKGIVAITVLLGVFLIFDIPRDHASLVIAGLLLLSRKMASKMMLSFIDWQLLVLFIGLFIVNHELNKTELVQTLLSFLSSHHIDIQTPGWLFSISTMLSNMISNVPAVMLLLPFATSTFMGSLLALSSTLAGNMFIVGSLANIIVISQAANLGVYISWKKHAAVGIPISLITLGLAGLWLYARYSFL